jgi:hypothetical protein
LPGAPVAFVQADAPVVGAVPGHDLGGPVGAAIQGNLKAHVPAAADSAVGLERPVYSMLFVVGRNDDVETQRDLP